MSSGKGPLSGLGGPFVNMSRESQLGVLFVGLAVVVYQPTPTTASFGDLPFYHLAKIEDGYFGNDEKCELCDKEIPATPVWV